MSNKLLLIASMFTLAFVDIHALAEERPLSAIDTQLEQKIAAAQAADDAVHHREAYALWSPLAEQGSAVAQTRLGVLYRRGDGVCRDDDKAAEWFLKAANQEFVEAYRNLGDLYALSKGPLHDTNVAIAWYKKAADQGDLSSENSLAELYWQVQDSQKAVYWMEKAAEQGAVTDGEQGAVSTLNASALGGIYKEGKAIPKDYIKAVYWYSKAAEKGLPSAQFYLGELYEQGLGVTTNLVEAYKWYALAAIGDTAGNEKYAAEDIQRRDKVTAQMTPAQLVKAKGLVSDFKIKPFMPPPPKVIPREPGLNCP